MTAQKKLEKCFERWNLHCSSHSHLPADSRQQITDNHSEDRSALVYDFSTFTLKPSSTSAFKLWWETSLGCEHLISPGCAQPRTHQRTHTYRRTQLISLGVSGRLNSVGHDIRIMSRHVSLSCSLPTSHAHTARRQITNFLFITPRKNYLLFLRITVIDAESCSMHVQRCCSISQRELDKWLSDNVRKAI